MSALTIQQAFDLAVRHHQAGELPKAAELYRQILAIQPAHIGALHYLGVVAHQLGQHERAAELIREAITLDPADPTAHSNLGEALRAVGQFPQAIASFRRAIALKPDYAEAHNNLGNALREQGDLEEAVFACRRALALMPSFAQAHNNLGVALAAQGRLPEAIATYRQALQFAPGHTQALKNLGVALMAGNRVDDAVAVFEQAMELDPVDWETQKNLVAALTANGQLDRAIAISQRALEIKPDNAEIFNNLGIALLGKKNFDDAVRAFQRALELNPQFVQAWMNLGTAFSDQGRIDEAIAAGQRALALDPTSANVFNNLGNMLKEQGRLREAIDAFRQAIHLDERTSSVHSNLILSQLYLADPDSQSVAADLRRWHSLFGRPAEARHLRPTNDRDPARRIRVGYVSADFRDHVVGRNLRPLFAHHCHQAFEIFCYANHLLPDELTEEFRRESDHWRNIVGMTDAAVAELIRNDVVDILVDLGQHTAGNRLPVFAHKPAPVQVSFAGYPESSGVEAIECRISDRWLESKGPAELVFLLDSFWCYNPCWIDLPVNELPARDCGRITFGSLTNFCKINDPTLRLWAQVLRRTNDSRLVLLCRPGSHRLEVTDFFAREGIEGSRVDFVAPGPRKSYLESYHRLDVMLDTFPYGGHTTSLDALWMGVPVVSLAGKTPVSRAGLSILSNLGLPELVTDSREDYVRIATELAGDLPRLGHLRATLRGRMESSVLMDAPRFTRQIEGAYRAMWQRWCAREAL